MENVISSIKDNINIRLKNPFIGAFLISWLSLHIKGVSIFLLVDTQEKIAMLIKKEWLFWGDFLFPFLLSLSLLVSLPLINLLYDHFHCGWVIPKRLKISRNKTIAEVHAEKKYIREYEYGKLSALINARDTLENSVYELSDVVEEFRSNCSMADKDRFIKLQSVSHEIINAVATLSSTVKEKNDEII